MTMVLGTAENVMLCHIITCAYMYIASITILHKVRPEYSLYGYIFV